MGLAWRKPRSHHPTSRVVPGQQAKFWPNKCILNCSRGNTGMHPWPAPWASPMGSYLTQGHQFCHTGSTGRPGKHGETTHTNTHTLTRTRDTTGTGTPGPSWAQNRDTDNLPLFRRLRNNLWLRNDAVASSACDTHVSVHRPACCSASSCACCFCVHSGSVSSSTGTQHCKTTPMPAKPRV